MAKLKDVLVNVVPKINPQKAQEAAKSFGDAVQGGLKGIKATVAKAGATGDKWMNRATKGIAILEQITSVINKMYDKVVDLTGTAGDIADLAYALGTTETRLLSVQRAFGEAGMGNVSGLNDMMVKYQEAVTAGKIELVEGQDILGGFLDMLSGLKKLSKEEQDSILAEVGFGKQNVMMKKLLGTDLEQVRANLLSEAERNKNRAYAGVLGGYSDLGDTMEYLQREQELAMMLQLGAEATKDAIDAINKTHEFELLRAEQYKAGDLVEGAKLSGGIEAVQTTIPNLLKGILTALVGDVEMRSIDLSMDTPFGRVGGELPLGAFLSRLIQLFENFFTVLQNSGSQLLLMLDSDSSSNN